jgi:hypothetical protein
MGISKRRVTRMEFKLRLTPEVKHRLNVLLKEFPERYENISHVFRCAIMMLYFSEIDEMGRRRKPMRRYEE